MPEKSEPNSEHEAAALHHEHHRSHRAGWLRAAVLGANDGAISVASIIVGVASAHAAYHEIMVAGAAGLAAGAMSMAAGEYVSVSSQADTEKADLAKESYELENNPDEEFQELVEIYEQRGLSPQLASEVATSLTAHNALEAHARDELGITETLSARPVQAALASAAAFIVGAFLPLLAATISPGSAVVPTVVGFTMLVLAALGAMAAFAGGASLIIGAARVMLWGALAMAITAAVGALFHLSA